MTTRQAGVPTRRGGAADLGITSGQMQEPSEKAGSEQPTAPFQQSPGIAPCVASRHFRKDVNVIGLDAIIFGGGVSGLWLLDVLSRRGCHVVLLEAGELGSAQTVGSQGIIHGGLKYSLQGLLTRSASNIREMPELWRRSLLGANSPTLNHTRVRTDYCYLWQTNSLASHAGMIGARFGLRVRPEVLSTEERPAALANVPGVVAKLPEQVISPVSLMTDFLQQYRDRILKINFPGGVRFDLASPGEITAVHLDAGPGHKGLSFAPQQVVFAAGSGNAALREAVELSSSIMQRRPLHMVLARGPLPPLNGHCVDGARTRVTITSDFDSRERTVWQIGGQVAEDGVNMTPAELIAYTQNELAAVLPDVHFDGVEWSTYRVDRAEGTTPSGSRPETIQILCAGNVTTGWPTKLVLAPVLANEIAARVSQPSRADLFSTSAFAHWERPAVALPPWETAAPWVSGQSSSDPSQSKAA
jgi:glycine/D-amino acid oxidase-like deaminating enzyme